MSEETMLHQKIKSLERSLEFYKSRVQLLEANQSKMRDPERVLVCDILANGQLLPDPDGKRYNTRPNDAKWISVEDEPKKNGHYQIWDNGYGEGFFHDGEWKSTDRPAKNAMGVQCLRVTLHPTHYMPLPTPPKQSSEGEEG